MQDSSKLLTTENLLAIIVATLSALAAFAAFQSAKIDSTSTDNYFLSQSVLSDGNTILLSASQDIMRDYRLVDNSETFGDTDPELAELMLLNLSQAGFDSYERSGDFDDQYYDDVYLDADEYFDEYDQLFVSAAHDSNRAVAYQLTVLIMALALSFSAWASLADAGSRTRQIFLVLSLIAMVIGLAQMLMIPAPLAA